MSEKKNCFLGSSTNTESSNLVTSHLHDLSDGNEKEHNQKGRRGTYQVTHSEVYNCVHCNFTIHSRGQIKHHLRDKHSSDGLPFVPYTSKKFINIKGLYHISDPKDILNSLSERHCNEFDYCYFCRFMFNTARKLKMHMKRKHSICPYCGYKIRRNMSLQHHILKKHRDEKPLVCLYCDYRSNRTNNLAGHIRGCHTNDRPFACSFCDYKSARAASVKRHIRVRHLHTEKSFTCPHCDFVTVYTHHLKSHIAGMHANDRPMQCSQCEYRAVDRNLLKAHIQRKHGEKKLHCPQCDYKTNDKVSIKRHLAYCFRERKLNCVYCEFSTLQNKVLTNHIVTVHKDIVFKAIGLS